MPARILARLAALLAALLLVAPAAAEPADIAAASRSVVRVVIVATDGEQAYFVGHGSGVAIAPDKVVTNAHVVEMLAEDSSLMLGVVPSQGKGSIEARVIAYAPGQDLALLQLAAGARLPRAAVYGGPVEDGAQVVAIGYPGGVDAAQGLSPADLIQPQATVRTRGNVSSGRSARRFDTILHTAPLGSGNSGGPLVDNCGRIVGINSFGSIAGEGDAEFFFAVSARELMSFLRKAGVQPQVAGTACRSLAEIEAEEDARAAAEKSARDAEAKAAADARAAAEAKAQRQAELRLIAERENWLAGAGLLLALAVVAAGAAMLLLQKGRGGPAKGVGAGALLLLVGAIVAFLARPQLVAETRASPEAQESAAEGGSSAAAPEGALLCTFVPDRSRVTVSATDDVLFDWRSDGCVNGRTQYAEVAGSEARPRWSRIFVPNVDPEVSDVSFVPATGEYRIDRYLPDADTLSAARAARARGSVSGCSADPSVVAKLAAMQAEVRTALPPRPNERIVYRCRASG